MKTISFLLQSAVRLMLLFVVALLAPQLLAAPVSAGLLVANLVPGGALTVTQQIDDNAENLQRDISDDIVMMRPDRFPMTTFMNNMKRGKGCKAVKVEWQQSEYYQRADKVSLAVSVAGTAGAPVYVKPTNAGIWNVSDIVYFPDKIVSDRPLTARVLEVHETNGLLLKALSVENIPTISLDEPMIRQATAVSETTASIAPRAEDPDVEWNYVQTFMMQVEISKIRKAIRTFSGDDEQRNILQQVYDFRNSEENTHLFGNRSISIDPVTKKKVWTMSGVDYYIDKTLDYNYHPEVGLKTKHFNSWCRNLFNDNAGSDQRLLLVDEYLMEEILNIEAFQKQLNAKNTEVVYGVRVNRIQTGFGELLIKFHKGFAENGKQHFGIALDMNHIRPRFLEKMQSKQLMLDESGQSRVKATRSHETRTLEVRYPKTHARIVGYSQEPPAPEPEEE